MRTTMIFIFIMMFATPVVARAMDDLMPASSEDLEQFDRAMAVHQQQQEQRQQKKDKGDKKERLPKKDSFGNRVTTEAMRLQTGAGTKNGDTANRWSGGRRQNERDSATTSPGNRDRGDRGGDSSGRGGRRGGH